MMLYILQTIAFQLVFLLVYELFLKRETFFTYNRVYLLLTPVVALLLPLLKIPVLQAVVPAESIVILPEVFIGQTTEAPGTQQLSLAAAQSFQNLDWWILAYAAGFIFSLGIFFNKFRILRRLFSYKPILEDREIRIVEVPQSKIACTFYNTIFLGAELSENEREQILSHELVHVKQKHTLDLLFFELLKIIFWFNPLVYMFQSRISALHEYLADAGVVKNVKKQDYFQQLLNSAFNTEDVSFINQFFNHSIIKKRIIMLQKSRSKSTSKFKFLIVLPLLLAMLTYVACSEEPVTTQEEKEATAQQKLQQIKSIINDGTALTAEDRKEIEKILSTISAEEMQSSLPGQKVQVQRLNNAVSGTDDVPFAVIEEVPVFPGCESLKSNEERKDCMSVKVTEFVQNNFDTSLGKQLGLTGVNRVYVQFRIKKDGIVEVMGARAPHPALQEEAERVVNLLPQMTPGKQKGQEVGVLYSLPITFRAGE